MFRKRSLIASNISICAVFLAVVHNNSLRVRTYLTRSAILHPTLSPWQNIWANADPISFLELTGFNRRSFNILLHVLFPVPNPQQYGRRRLLDEKDRLGLYLLYVNSRMTYPNLCLLFGCTPRCCVIVNDMMKHVYRTLKVNREARVRFPKTAREKRSLARLVQRRQPRVKDVIGFTDGMSIPVQCAPDMNLQAIDYNGYHHDTMCNNVFCFAPTGKIIYSCINFPGSFHDSGLVNVWSWNILVDTRSVSTKVFQGQVTCSTNLSGQCLNEQEIIWPQAFSSDASSEAKIDLHKA
jgi:DDE superfamily endonuclease